MLTNINPINFYSKLAKHSTVHRGTSSTQCFHWFKGPYIVRYSRVLVFLPLPELWMSPSPFIIPPSSCRIMKGEGDIQNSGNSIMMQRSRGQTITIIPSTPQLEASVRSGLESQHEKHQEDWNTCWRHLNWIIWMVHWRPWKEAALMICLIRSERELYSEWNVNDT